MPTDQIGLARALEEEYVRLHGTPCGEVEELSSGDDLKRLYKRIHQDAKAGRPRSALCISGGGIRSATFALGVLQELARRGILERFDYLSTVSGGGYIGSWLSSYVRRRKGGIAEVAGELGRAAAPAADAEAPAQPALANPLEPEPDPIVYLRKYSNYLTPKLGLFSGDTWALAATYVRNLLLNWLMLLPILFALLAVPRLLVALLYSVPDRYVLHFGGLALPLLSIAVVYLALTRPAYNKAPQGWLYTNSAFQKLALLPFLLASILFVFLWGRRAPQFKDWKQWIWVGVAFAVMSALASLVYVARYAWASRRERRSDVKPGSTTGRYVTKKVLLELLAAILAGLVAAGLLYFFATQLFENPLASRVPPPSPDMWKLYPPSLPGLTTELYACFGVPLVLFVLFAQAALFVGLASWYNEEYDREWWARAAGWVLLAGVVWAAMAAITIYGPVLIYEFPRIAASVGTVSGLISVLGGRSAQTSAKEKKPGEKVDAKAAMNLSLGVIASIFAVFLLALLSLVTSEVLINVKDLDQLRSRNFALLAESQYKLTDPGSEVEHLDVRWKRTLEPPAYPALDLERFRSLRHLYVVDQTRWKEGLVLVFLFPLVGVLASVFIGVNQFSMHAMYRNRLIRAYLGASRGRTRQTPNPFTGFDPNDNFSMHQLRPESFWMHSFQNLGTFIAELKKADDPLAAYIYEQLSARTRRLFDEHEKHAEAAAESLFADLNRIIDQHDLSTRTPTPEAPDPLRSLKNRQLMNTHFADGLNPCTTGKPFHIVNATLNLVAGKELAWQERKADSFTFSPLHSGNRRLGYRPSRVYGGPGGISLGTAVAISGAAASPNMGYNSSPALSFLLTLFNVRLGWWLGNPGSAGDDTYSLRNPKVSLRPLIDELTGSTDETHPYVYLSDGGHFENLALYEMVLRRCHLIVLSDAGADFSFGFDDLGNAVRKIRIDLGISITFEAMDIFPRSPQKPANAKYCAVGTIHYEDVDGAGAEPGTLLYIKPAVYFDKESRDIYNYARQNPQFPHESTADQFFSESQFESYRALGETTIRDICRVGNLEGDTVEDLMEAAERYVASPPKD